MARARILVVDDSAVFRRALSDAFAGDPALEVVGTASNGRLALDQIQRLKPDLVTLDVEISAAELKRRLKSWKPPRPHYDNGVLGKYARHVTSASEGALVR